MIGSGSGEKNLSMRAVGGEGVGGGREIWGAADEEREKWDHFGCVDNGNVEVAWR